MADTLRRNQLLVSDFGLFVEGQTERVASFSEVQIPAIENEVNTLRQTDRTGKQVLIKSVGANRLKDGQITAKYAATEFKDPLSDWHQKVRDGLMNEARKNAALVVFRVDGTEAMRFNMTHCFISSWKIANLSTKSNEAATIEVKIDFEHIEVKWAGGGA